MAEGLNPEFAARAIAGVTVEAAPQSSDPAVSRTSADGLLGYASEEALFTHAEAIRDTRVALTVVGGEIRYRA